jgi:hypothetical protein
MKGAMVIGLFAALASAPGAAGAARDDPAPVTVETVQVMRGGEGLKKVRFDGAEDFDERPTHFEATLSTASGPRLYDIALDFGAYQVPLRLISGQRHGQPLRFKVTAPEYVQCERPTVNTIAARAPSGTIDERLDLLVRARRLLDLCGGSAYQYERPKLVLKYYEANCALATRGSSFVIHDDARMRLAGIPRTQAVRDAETGCNGRGIGVALNGQWSDARDALDRGDHAAAFATAEDLLGKLDDPKWKEGFAAQRLNGDLVRELKVVALVGEQNAVAHDTPNRAVEINDQLLTLRADDEFAIAMDKVGATRQRLDADRVYLKGLAAAAAGPP